MPPIHGTQIHFCVGTGHEKFSRLVGTIRTCPVLLSRSVHHARFTNAMVTASVFTLFIICSFMNMLVLMLVLTLVLTLALTLVLTLVFMLMLTSMLVSFISYCLLHTQQAGKCLMSLFSSTYRKRDCWAPFPLPNISHSLKSSPVHRVQSLPLSCTVVE